MKELDIEIQVYKYLHKGVILKYLNQELKIFIKKSISIEEKQEIPTDKVDILINKVDILIDLMTKIIKQSEPQIKQGNKEADKKADINL